MLIPRFAIAAALLSVGALVAGGCSKEPATVAAAIEIPEGEKDPAVWGKKYPRHYDSYLKNAEKTQKYSKYKSDNEDRISPWPFQVLLWDGMGFAMEYNEPQGHTESVRDQLLIHASRRAPGGVCLSCKSPYAPELKEKLGLDYFRKPYDEVHAQIPPSGRETGVMCLDCHDPKTHALRISRWTLKEGLKAIGKDESKLTRQELTTLVCAQCHVTYVIPKDAEGKSVYLKFPWANGRWGYIPIEGIIKQIKDENIREWKHKVTGLKLSHIRHPEFELFSAPGNIHFAAGVSCADCHMVYEVVGKTKITSHRWESPFKKNMKACMQCHTQSAEWLKEQVWIRQDRVNHMFTKAGYAVAEAALTIEQANATPGVDQALLDKAKGLYEEAYYRNTFIGAENSMGFHNPSEALRVLGDALGQAKETTMLAQEAILKAQGTPKHFDMATIDAIVKERYLTKDGKTQFRPNVARKAALLDPLQTAAAK
ncbi:MAG TPA: ammonia-forming cytochrome c nitrite reductase subunit c552 [Candidatus Sulfotelmatobacter sp.]|nr:ammonia-forming cytochrome c nitrite reductase subunit c552 [Candidatus Sulfotelmatobacter sp.]